MALLTVVLIYWQMSFRAPEIISGVPGDIKNLYEKLKEEQKKRNLPTVSDAAKYVKISKMKFLDKQ